MYDTIICKYKLPMPENPNGYSGSVDFQTKDFENALDVYDILEDGSLWANRYEMEHVPGNGESKTFSGKFGHFVTKKQWREHLKINATVFMYDFQQNNDSDYDYSIEYKLDIKDGFVKNAVVSEFKCLENASRKKRDKEMWEGIKKRQLFESKFYYKYGIKYWNKFVRYFFKTHRAFFSFMIKFAHKIEHKLFV